MEKKTLKEWRMESGKLQQQVADEIGATQTSVSRWEVKKENLQNVPYKTLKKLANAVGCSPWDFDYGDEEEGGGADV